MIRYFTYTLVFVCSIGYASLVVAHTEGASLERVVGSYTIDVGYEPEKPTTAERIVFDFDLRDADDARVDFDSVWVRLEQDERLTLATGINRNAVGGATLVWVPPVASEAQMTVRYMRAGSVLVETTFAVPVTQGAESRSVPEGVRALLFGSLGVLIGMIVARYAKRT
jgi:hypothetical protein